MAAERRLEPVQKVVSAMDPRISVVIVTWNRCDALQEALDSVLAQDFDGYEIVVVDNGSVDDTPRLVRQDFPQVRYVRLPENMGPAVARNVGIVNSGANIILTLDDDEMLMDRDGLQKAYDRFQQLPGLAALSCREIPYCPDRPQSSNYEGDPAAPNEMERYVFLISVGMTFFRRRFLEEAGYFDPMFWRVEDTEFSYRLGRACGRALYCPQIRILHRMHAIRRDLARTKYYRFRNCMIINWRYLPLPDALVYTVWQLGAEAVRALREGWLPHYLRALMELMAKLPKTIIFERDPVSRQIMRRIYYLQTHRAQDYHEVEDSVIGFWEYYLHHFRSRFTQRQRSS
jgi:glycosyltransferase involved in cell wall biosynthesis